ncbi:hypothetical protein F2Q68_00029875 [Brassica cretica]|uniref:Cysteine-rich receptor-like protein kinase 10 n=1 Tax=Brassica cretica TaxID=69181 RepID=A0A8S9GB75_BRACR|nr:hypothetical protein F2Q68_00029875 [Brassica cretica]
MSSCTSFIFIFLFSFLTSSKVFAQEPTYVHHSCPNTTTYSRNSTSFTNLRTLLSTLSSPNASYVTGFQNATVGEPPERVSGLFSCFGGVSPELCRSCVAFSVKDILTRCPNEKEVTAYYNQCMLRYTFVRASILDPTYVYHVCPNTTTYSRNSIYSTNLRTLLSSLSSPFNSYSPGFQNNTAGQSPDRVTGLFLCRGDFTPEYCRSCVTFAVNDTLNRCPNQREVTLYYDECMLRYSDRNILLDSSLDNGIILYNTQNVTSNQTGFRNLVLSTINQAATVASSSPRRFATGKANLTAFQTLYGLVQCTPDLTSQECLRCLNQIVNQLPMDKIGGRLIVPSCNSRYELYPFYNESNIRAPQPQLDSAPPPQLDSAPPPQPISIPSPQQGNILLDADMNPKVADMNPKVADFGMARIFGIDQTKANTRRVVGTYGYMSPEYAMYGHFSMKSDVYSFGVLVLEIISGKKNSSLYQMDDSAGNLVTYSWRLWSNGLLLGLVDPSFQDDYQTNEITRCIHIALLCVQEEAEDRPTMSAVVQMLTTNSIALAKPRPPGFFFRIRDEEVEKVGPSTHTSALCSVDDASISSVAPR